MEVFRSACHDTKYGCVTTGKAENGVMDSAKCFVVCPGCQGYRGWIKSDDS